MPRWLRWALSALGALLTLVGLALVLVLGPDSRFTTGPHEIDTTGIAVVTAPGSFTWSGLQVDVLAEVPVNKPVFVGLGNDVDIENYLAESERLQASSLLTPNSFLPFGTPHKPEVTLIEGKPRLPGAPTALDWWIADSAGLGGASISTTLPDQNVSAVILSVGSSNLNGLEVSFAYGIKGGFWKGLGLLALGVGALWIVRLLARQEADDSEFGEVDDVVYIYVDDDGVEHELSAEEAVHYEVVAEEVIEPEASDDDGDEASISVEDEGVEPETVAEPEPETVAEPEPETVAEPEPEPETEVELVDEPEVEAADDVEPREEPTAVEPKVVYVVVDEDGVEHEVSEDELGDYEIVDEEDDA